MNKGFNQVPLQRLSNLGTDVLGENIVRETAVELRALNENNDPYTFATLLATPINLVELLAGHITTEGYALKPVTHASIVQSDKPYFSVEYKDKLRLEVPKRIVTTSCGACNHPELMVDGIGNLVTNQPFSDVNLQQIQVALSTLTSEMNLFNKTGGCHGSALYGIDSSISHVSEDIGRHNAVDKTVGMAILSGDADLAKYMLLLSGRCGWDIVAKAVRTGIPAIASLGAFSTAAINLARDHNITLYGFVAESGAWKVGFTDQSSPSIDVVD
tara:strand:+ start:494 stop:1309 length:816 start_codon:yes stop_codon:yes gene_type:complete